MASRPPSQLPPEMPENPAVDADIPDSGPIEPAGGIISEPPAPDGSDEDSG